MHSKAVIRWIAETGKVCVTIISVAGSVLTAADGVITAIRAAFAAASNAKSESVAVTLKQAVNDTATLSAQGTAGDRAYWMMLDENGQHHRIETPAPPQTIINGDGTINYTSGAGSTFVDEVVNSCVTQGGAAFLECTGAWVGSSRQ